MSKSFSVVLTLVASVFVASRWWASAAYVPTAIDVFQLWPPHVFGLNLVGTYAAFCVVHVAWSAEVRAGMFRAMTVSVAFGLVAMIAEAPALFLGVDFSDVLQTGGADRLRRGQPAQNPDVLQDEVLGWRHHPGSEFRGAVSGDLVDVLRIASTRTYDADVVYDANGFRNSAVLDHAEIVVVGDSFVEAALVPLEETLVMRLEQATGNSVLNLGVIGYGPEQERLALARYGLPLNPRFVLWFFFEGNDLADTGRFDFLQEQRRSGVVLRRGFRERSFHRNSLSWLAERTQPRRKADSEYARQRRCRFERAVDPADRDVYFAYLNPHPTAASHLDKAMSEILAASVEARAAGAEFLLFYVPVKLRVLAGTCDFDPETVVGRWEPNSQPEAMRAFAADAGIRYIDLTTPLRRSASEGRLPYYSDDGHWNATGHEVVTKVAIEELRALAGADDTPRR